MVVSIPGAADATVYDAVEVAQRGLMGVTGSVELPERYRTEPGTAAPD